LLEVVCWIWCLRALNWIPWLLKLPWLGISEINWLICFLEDV
jgi:hypothetical protein